MNILHLVSYAVFSGPLPPTLQLAAAQRDLGHRVWLNFDTLRGPFSPFEEAAGPRVASTWLPHRPLGLAPKAGPCQWWQDRRRLRQLADELQLDVVHTHLSHDQALVAFSGLQNVAKIHTLHSRRPLGRQPGRRLLWRATDAVVVRCEADRRRVEAFGLKKKVPVRCVPGSIDAKAWPAASAELAAGFRARHHIPTNAPVLLHVALMTGRGQQELLQAWSRAFGAVSTQAPFLVFVGDGPERDRLAEQARTSRVGSCVRFVGYLEADALRAAYSSSQAAFVAQPGNDASARAALEALHFGLHVMVVAAEPDDALGTLATHRWADAVSSRDPELLAQMLTRWWQVGPWQNRQGSSSKKAFADERHPRLEAKQTVELYQEARAKGLPAGDRAR